MANPLDRDYGFWSLLRFSLPSIGMMVFLSLYTIVDGVFISRFVGTAALSAVNIVFPLLNVVIGLGVMLATGGSAIVARKLGEGKPTQARQDLTLLVLFGAGTGLILSLVGLFFSAPLSRLLGSDEALLPYCVDYLRLMLLFAPANVLQLLFQSFFVTAGRPGLGLGLTVASGLTNALLDYLFIVPLDLGVAGAALATAAGWLVMTTAGLLFFVRRREGLCFARPTWDAPMLLRACANGSSEMVSNLSSAVVTYLYNIIMLDLIGQDGVAAITIVLYTQFLLVSLYMGFSMGAAPVVSFNYGAANWPRLRRVFRCCMTFLTLSSALTFALSLAGAPTLVGIFAPLDSPVYPLALHGYGLFAISFLLCGFNGFASSFFTALSDGLTSAILSFARTFGFLTAALLLLPRWLGVDGVWLAVPVAEGLCLLLTLFFLLHKRDQYHYV